jgi:hypothetical protein
MPQRHPTLIAVADKHLISFSTIKVEDQSNDYVTCYTVTSFGDMFDIKLRAQLKGR